MPRSGFLLFTAMIFSSLCLYTPRIWAWDYDPWYIGGFRASSASIHPDAPTSFFIGGEWRGEYDAVTLRALELVRQGMSPCEAAAQAQLEKGSGRTDYGPLSGRGEYDLPTIHLADP